MIQEKDFLYRVPVKNALVTAPGKQVRNPEILVDLEGGEFMHGDILDANSTNKLIDQSVKDAIDNSIENGNYVTKDLLEAETSARTKSDEDLNAKIKAEQTRAEGKEKEISDKLAIVDGDSNTEGSFRKAIADVIAAAPEDLDTLKEIADKLAGNDDLHTALNQAITEKADASALTNEVSRATGVENDLRTAIGTKADATALSNYVLTTALNQQVDTLNAAISAKQDAGSYVPYDQTVTSRYRIDKDLMIDNSEGSAVLSTYNISAISNSNTEIQINPDGITMRDDDNTIILNRTGIILPNGDNDHVLTSNGSTINMANYLKESDVSGQFAAKADRSDLITLEQKVTANTTAIEGKQDEGNYVPYTQQSGAGYEMEIGFVYNYTTPGNAHITTLIGGDISMYENNGPHTYITAGLVSVQYPMEGYIDITPESITGGNRSDLFHFKLNENGVKLRGGDNNHVLTSNGSTIDITQYALKTELPDVSIDMLSYGVEWDITVADPTCTRIGNPLFHKSLPIQSEYKGCVVKNGKLQYYLNPNDWSKKSNGEPSHLDGTDGDVMIRIPKFYGKSGSNGNKRWVRISTVKVDASWVEIPEMFISAYRNTIYTDGDAIKVASVVSTDAKYRGGGRRPEYDQYLTTDQFKTDLGKPVSGISRATMRTYAAAAGQEILCYEFYKWIFYWNYVIEYANFNSQKEFNSELTSDGYHQGGLGPGLTNLDWYKWNTYNETCAITPCGYTNEFGNFSGVKAIQFQSPETTLYANRWRGFENPFGDIWTSLDGIVIKRDAAKSNSNVYTTTDVLKYGEDYSLFDIAGVEVAQDGFVVTFDLGSKAEIIPSSITESESTYKCDNHWCNADSIENRVLIVGGSASNNTQAGLGFFNSRYAESYIGNSVGFRSLVRV